MTAQLVKDRAVERYTGWALGRDILRGNARCHSLPRSAGTQEDQEEDEKACATCHHR